MSTEVANRIGRVRRSLHDMRKRGGREKHEMKNVSYPLPPMPLFSFLPFPYPPSPPPPPDLTPATRDTLARRASRTFSQVFLSRLTNRQLGGLLNLHL